MGNEIRVLMLLPTLYVSSGVANYAMTYFRAIDKTRIHMDFAIYEDLPSPYYEEIRKLGSKVFVLPSLRNIAKHYKKCEEILTNGNYDIVHDNSLINTCPMMVAAKKVGIPVRILHSHNSRLGETNLKEFRNKLFLPLLRKQATHYVACSKVAGYSMFANRKFYVINNVIDAKTNKFDADVRNMVRKKMKASNKFVVITVGRVTSQKNPFFAMDVFAEVVKKNPRFEYWWVGSGPLDDALVKYVEKKDISGNVRLLGNRTDVKDFYQASDCFFLPSIFEGFGIVNIEAQSMGLPCIVSDVIPHEVNYSGLVEFVSLSENCAFWADKIINSTNNKITRSIYNQKLRNSVYSSQKAGENLYNMYKKTLRW